MAAGVTEIMDSNYIYDSLPGLHGHFTVAVDVRQVPQRNIEGRRQNTLGQTIEKMKTDYTN
jgi:hypothetical protein